MSDWTFFTNHGHIIFLLARHPEYTVREIALEVGITERAALRIIGELERDEFIQITKHGRKNCYKINQKRHLKHSIEEKCTVGHLLKTVVGP